MDLSSSSRALIYILSTVPALDIYRYLLQSPPCRWLQYKTSTLLPHLTDEILFSKLEGPNSVHPGYVLTEKVL